MALAAAGRRVALNCRRSEPLEHLAADLTDALVVPFNVAEAVEAGFSKIRQAWDHLDLLFNNARQFNAPMTSWT